jgi:trigger factor
MKITLEKLPKSEVKFTIELDETELAKYRELAVEQLGKDVKIDGFRDGKAPAFEVENKVGKDQFFQVVMRFALPDTFAKAVEQEKVEVISRPNVNIVSQIPLKYEAISSLVPEVKLKEYSDIKVPEVKVEITDEETTAVINEMRRMQAVYSERKDSVQKGDKVEIDFTGKDEGGVELENTASKNHPLFVGDGTLVPGFEDNLIGMNVGDKKTFDVTFPADYTHKPFQNKKVIFDVEMKKAEEVKIPALDDALIEKVVGKKVSEEEFVKSVKADLVRQKTNDARMQRENKLLEELLARAEIELSDTLIDDELEFIIEQVKSDLARRNLDFAQYEEYLKSQGKNLKDEKRKEAVDRLKIRLLVNELFKREKIEVSDEEVQKAVDSMTAVYPEDEVKKLKEAYQPNSQQWMQLKNNMRLKKFFDGFLETV